MPLKKKKSIKKKLDQSKLQRPPVVAVLGHVDHGKTTLLDAIRQTNIVSKEHGGITQHIGAYQVEYQKESITFIDTPGHAAFVKMRSRGASVTDLVVLVIAADDGVKPQTKESLAHIKQAKVHFLVVINKIDLAGASVDKVKAQLAENEVLVEGYGGDIVCLEVSAKQKKGLDELLEMILLIAKMENLKANPKANLKAVVIESSLDSKKGPLATVLVQNGTLKLGDQLMTEDIEGKVKAMLDANGKKLEKALPSTPVEVLGFKKAPPVGAKVEILMGSKEKKEEKEMKEIKEKKVVKDKKTITKDEEKEDDNKIRVILKADTIGTLEAIEANLPEEVEVILAGVGQITDSDVLLALSTKASVLAFNVKTPGLVKKLAETEKVDIKTYNIIYQLLEDIEKKVLKILEPTIDEETLGEAEIIAEFNIKGKHIAGCKIKKGKFSKNNPVHLKRKDKIIADAKITSFQKEREEVNEAKAGDEVGLVLSPDLDFKIDDGIISYKK